MNGSGSLRRRLGRDRRMSRRRLAAAGRGQRHDPRRLGRGLGRRRPAAPCRRRPAVPRAPSPARLRGRRPAGSSIVLGLDLDPGLQPGGVVRRRCAVDLRLTGRRGGHQELVVLHVGDAVPGQRHDPSVGTAARPVGWSGCWACSSGPALSVARQQVHEPGDERQQDAGPRRPPPSRVRIGFWLNAPSTTGRPAVEPAAPARPAPGRHVRLARRPGTAAVVRRRAGWGAGCGP